MLHETPNNLPSKGRHSISSCKGNFYPVKDTISYERREHTPSKLVKPKVRENVSKIVETKLMEQISLLMSFISERKRVSTQPGRKHGFKYYLSKTHQVGSNRRKEI